MSIKTMARRVTARMGSQILTVKTHSPALMTGVGVIGFVATAVLASRATLKLSEVLEKGEKELRAIDPEKEEELEKKSFGVQLQVAIEIAKLYTPAVIVGVGSIAMFTGSHMILKRRNAGLVAAYTTLDQTLRNYRKRVVADQGKEKDFEYLHGVEEREIVVEGKNGPETQTVKGLDQEALKKADPETEYKRVFYGPEKDEFGELIPSGDPGNKNWSDIPNQNQFFLQMRQSEANDLLRLQGHVFLNQVYDLLGFEPTAAGQLVGWVKNPKDGAGDGYIDFGVWNEGVYEGKRWLNGDKDSLLLDFNVDGPILGALKKV